MRAHSLGSAKFLFDDRALSHRVNPEPPSARQRSSNGSDPGGGGDFLRDSTRGGTTHVNATRWGSERAALKSPHSPYKLAKDKMQQQQQQHELNDVSGSPETAGSLAPPTTVSSPCGCSGEVTRPTSTKGNDPKTPRTARRALGTREVLRRSTWLGPEVSPLQNDQDAARLNSPSRYGIKYSAAAWPSPKQRGGVRRRINRNRGGKGGGNHGVNPGRVARQQPTMCSFQPNATCSTRVEFDPTDQALGAQVRCMHGPYPKCAVACVLKQGCFCPFVPGRTHQETRPKKYSVYTQPSA